MKTGRTPIPVVMYHTVGRPIPQWNWSFLTVPYEVFEDHLRWLAKSRYTTVGLDELYDHVEGKKTLPPRSVVLTFDDGYLDNWVYVAPLLSRYGFKGTVFINPEFVDPRDTIRPTLTDLQTGKCKEQDLEVRGFMSWQELQQLSDNGPLSIQSHGITHTWYPTSDKIIDFHHPEDGYYWIDWNATPEQKPYYLIEPQKTSVPFGLPIYEHGKSLGIQRYFPNPEEEQHLMDFVQHEGGTAFFTTSDWKQILFKEVDSFRKTSNTSGKKETKEEQQERFLFELIEAKQIIKERLGTTTDFLCWPGGGYNSISQELALKQYKAVTLGSADKTPIRNIPGDNPHFIRRIGVPGIEMKGKLTYTGGRYFVRFLDEYRKVPFARFRRQVLKFLYLFSAYFKNLD